MQPILAAGTFRALHRAEPGAVQEAVEGLRSRNYQRFGAARMYRATCPKAKNTTLPETNVANARNWAQADLLWRRRMIVLT
jgi:hypothetical protein